MSTPKQILSVETGEPIPYSFKKLTYRKFQAALEKLEDARTAVRKDRNRISEEAACDLIENAKQLMDEASNADVQQVMVEAIEFNQTSEVEAKKSE